MKKTKRIIKSKQIIFCEDSKSLRIYLQELRKNYKDRHENIDFMIENPPTSGDYIEMIKSSIKKIKQLEEERYIKFEKKYLVVDIDKSKENEIQKTKFQEMNTIANKNDIIPIYCDPNFELYLLLHFENCCLQNSREIDNKLIKHINKLYNKSIKKIDEIKSDNNIFKQICFNEEIIIQAIKHSEYNKSHNDNKTSLQDIIKEFINYGKQ